MKTSMNKDALTLIKQDHRAVEKLYRAYKAAEAGKQERSRLAEEICKSLELHAKMEEKHFYPEVQKASKTQGDLLIAEAYAEHMGMKVLVKAVKALPEGSVREATLEALMKTVKHHVKEEEEEILPEAQKVLGDEMLMELGTRMRSLSPSEKEIRAASRTSA